MEFLFILYYLSLSFYRVYLKINGFIIKKVQLVFALILAVLCVLNINASYPKACPLKSVFTFTLSIYTSTSPV